MIYRFSSETTGDLLMTQDVGSRLLGIMGKDVAPRGILEAGAMPAALKALAAAVAEDESRLARAARTSGADRGEASDVDPVTLRQHTWPFVEMLTRAEAAGEAVVWGV